MVHLRFAGEETELREVKRQSPSLGWQVSALTDTPPPLSGPSCRAFRQMSGVGQ